MSKKKKKGIDESLVWQAISIGAAIVGTIAGNKLTESEIKEQLKGKKK